MKVKRVIGRLISHNETVAIWIEDSNMVKHLLWRGMAWEIPKRYAKLKFHRFFGTIPHSLMNADTINILIKGVINVACSNCTKRRTNECPNHYKCYNTLGKPYWEWEGELHDL